jgi:hypothetical protein
MWLIVLAVFATVACSDNDGLPQQADPDFKPKNTTITFTDNNSPVVLIDEAHNNFHTAIGRYKAFKQVLTSDGYTVKRNQDALTLANLKNADILVIANALDPNRQDWSPPFHDAFDAKEVSLIKQWVFEGGSLLLIADHMPFPKASESLALAFGFTFTNGHVDRAIFRLDDGSLLKHPITTDPIFNATDIAKADGFEVSPYNGLIERDSGESKSIMQVRTFGGSAFQAPKNAQSLLVLRKGSTSLLPVVPFQVTAKTPKLSVEGWSQGAVLEFGEGRIAVFSEAMMFTSQVYMPTGEKHGLVSQGAEENEQFLLNVMHWLSNKL